MSIKFFITPVADSVPFDNDNDCNLVAENVQEAIEEICELSTGVSGKLITFSAFNTGNTKDKYMLVEHPSAPSNDSPFVTPFAGKIIGLAYTNSDNSSELDVLFKVNGTTQYTWQIRNKRTAYKVLNAGMFTVVQGDRISVYIQGVSGTNAQDPNITFVVSVSTLPDGEGGEVSI